MQRVPALMPACDRPMDATWGELSSTSIWANYGRRPPQVQGPQHACHPDSLEIAFVDRGCEFVSVEGRQVTVTEGNYVLIPPGSGHCSSTQNDESVGMTLHLSNRVIERAADELGVSSKWRPETCRPSPSLSGVLAGIRAELLRPDGRAGLVDGLAYYVCGELLRRHHGQDRQPAALSVDSNAWRLRRAVEMMHAQLSGAISLQDLADAAGLSRFRFAHLFKEAYGAPPYAYLQRLRVEIAAERIVGSTASLTEIALDCGLGSSSRLSQAIRREYATTPTAMRRAARS